MNEGWASHWHHRIMNALDLPQEIHLEFLVRHNQVICPHPGRPQPLPCRASWSGATSRSASAASRHEGGPGQAVRGPRERPRRVVPAPLPDRGAVRELDLFTWKPRGEHLVVVARSSDEEHWDDVKLGAPAADRQRAHSAIKIRDANHSGRRGLYLVHDHDGRDLDMTAADKTLHHLRTLWSHDVYPADLCTRQEDADERYGERLRREAGELTYRTLFISISMRRGVQFWLWRNFDDDDYTAPMTLA